MRRAKDHRVAILPILHGALPAGPHHEQSSGPDVRRRRADPHLDFALRDHAGAELRLFARPARLGAGLDDLDVDGHVCGDGDGLRAGEEGHGVDDVCGGAW